MSPFEYANGQLACGSVPLARLADEFGTPLYVYSAEAIRERYRRLAAAFAPLQPLICFAIKANANQAVLRLLRAEGAGFDIVSGGELYRALRASAAAALAALEVALEFAAQEESVDALDLGGGFPVAYRDTDQFTDIEAFAAPIVARLAPLAGRLHVHLEPGRYLVAEAGALLTTIQAVQDVARPRNLVADAG